MRWRSFLLKQLLSQNKQFWHNRRLQSLDTYKDLRLAKNITVSQKTHRSYCNSMNFLCSTRNTCSFHFRRGRTIALCKIYFKRKRILPVYWLPPFSLSMVTSPLVASLTRLSLSSKVIRCGKYIAALLCCQMECRPFVREILKHI